MRDVLTYKNDWENDRYFVDGVEIVDLIGVYICGKFYDVEGREVSVRYYDSGHEYSAKSRHYFVKETVFGVEKTFDLNTIVGTTKIIALFYERS